MKALAFRFRRTLPIGAYKETIRFFKRLGCLIDVIPDNISVTVVAHPLEEYEVSKVKRKIIRTVGKLNILHCSNIQIDHGHDHE